MNVTYVEDFCEYSESNEQSVEPKPKSRGANRMWIKTLEFESSEEAENYVTSRLIWKKSSSKNSLEGKKVEYRCSAGKYRTNECPAGLYLLYHSTNSKVSLFETECEHNNHNLDPNRGLSVDMKCFVREKFERGIQKPNAILAAIKQKQLVEPSKSKLISYLKQLRYEKCGQPTVSSRVIHSWCEAREQIPSDEDEPFVLDHIIHAEPSDTNEQELKIVLSTRRLLHNLRKSAMLQIDATHKLIWQGYPVMILGTSDKNQVFHPFGIAISNDETADDFASIFQAFHAFDLEWKPSILLADGSNSITEGFRDVFGEPKIRITCFSHVMKDLETQFKGLKKYGPCGQMKVDIHALQTSRDQSTFLKATQLFLEEWRGKHCQQVDECLKYFEEQWISKCSNWYEGAAAGYPSTNIGIEATTSAIKSKHTLRERLPVDEFLNNVSQLVAQWSKSRDPTSSNCVKFTDVPSISLHQWTEAYLWAVKNRKVLQHPHDDPECTAFYVKPSTSAAITPEDVSTYEGKMGRWTSFDEFNSVYYGTWRIVLNRKCVEGSDCNCPYFSKHLICKHVLGMQIRLKLVDPPPEVKSRSRGEKRKRGRPSKAKRALLID